MVTNEVGVALIVAHADCAPVLLADPGKKSIAAIHAGWRGILAGICGDALRALTAEFGAKPNEVQVAIGPMISRKHYEVGAEVAESFAARYGSRVVDRDGATPKLDLLAAIMVNLLEAGISPRALPARPPDTFSSPEFSSWRRDGEKMRGSILVITIL
jgi:hypothetical protein